MECLIYEQRFVSEKLQRDKRSVTICGIKG